VNRWCGILTFLVLSCVLCGVVGACYLRDGRRQAGHKRPTLSHNNVMERFRSRASSEERARFDELASAADAVSQTRATEMVSSSSQTTSFSQSALYKRVTPRISNGWWPAPTVQVRPERQSRRLSAVMESARGAAVVTALVHGMCRAHSSSRHVGHSLPLWKSGCSV